MSYIQDLIERVELEDWLDHVSIDWKYTAGKTNVILDTCPFCYEGGKIYVSVDKKVGTCFRGSCGSKFNLFSFAKKHLECDTPATIKHFEDFTGNIGVKAPRERAEPVKTPEAFSLPANISLPTESGKTLEYLTSRNVTLDTQKRFDMRFCHVGYFEYEEDGQIKRRGYNNRLLLPICDLDGEIKTFVGRDVTGYAEQRYMFPPLLPSGGKFLYGAHLALGKENLIINEGPFDVVSTHQAIHGMSEFENFGVVGTFGIHLSCSDEKNNDQLGVLLKMKEHGLKRIYMMWDGEWNALREALKAAKVLSIHGFEVFMCLLPEDTDPGEVKSQVIRDTVNKAIKYNQQLNMRWQLIPPYKQA